MSSIREEDGARRFSFATPPRLALVVSRFNTEVTGGLREGARAWLAEHGYEPVDHGPFLHDALDDYPVFCLRAAEAVAAERAEGLDSLGVVYKSVSSTLDEETVEAIKGILAEEGTAGEAAASPSQNGDPPASSMIPRSSARIRSAKRARCIAMNR